MKGIVLAGGSGTRLYPMTSAINKHLLPIYDKPMVYYPLSILMMAGIQDILIISTPEDLPNFKTLFGNGGQLGIRLSYAEQFSPDGLAQAFIIGEEFIGKDTVAMILGDNLFHGAGLIERLRTAVRNAEKGRATIFGYYVKDPERFGVMELSPEGKVLSIEEKPKNPRSNFAATGLYFYDKRVIEFAKKVKPSSRNELEITDLNNMYLEEGALDAITLGRGFVWMDAGTPQSLAEATIFIRSVEQFQDLKIACLEEIAYNNGWISREQVEAFAEKNSKNDYGKYLATVLKDPVKKQGLTR
ncbi:MAG: glucose-1-phosphate thymidylyltransferase RfbA [Methanomassiliicoccales archaeon]|nr:glucose-1-phosphate thymidylyltransferase RfbA [Methanomassiliicoccales archaeon]